MASVLNFNSMKATLDEVEKHPGDYLDRVLEGETVVLFRDDRAVAEIRPLKTSAGPRPFGLAAGEFVVPADEYLQMKLDQHGRRKIQPSQLTLDERLPERHDAEIDIVG